MSRALGHEMGWDGPEDAMREIADLTPHFAGVAYKVIAVDVRPVGEAATMTPALAGAP